MTRSEKISHGPITSLDDLLTAARAGDSRTLDQHGQLSADLPTFGGDEPNSTLEVWSWDVSRVLVGTCLSDLEIQPRSWLSGDAS